ncbi:MAG: hypothetical protein Q9212_004054 [Teloschistes hypoglaucus]
MEVEKARLDYVTSLSALSVTEVWEYRDGMVPRFRLMFSPIGCPRSSAQVPLSVFQTLFVGELEGQDLQHVADGETFPWLFAVIDRQIRYIGTWCKLTEL